MVLGFKKQFVSKILDGTKIHSIREDPHNRWKPGRKIHMATGVRTSYYDQFNEDECVSVQEIRIVYQKISVEGKEPMLVISATVDGKFALVNEIAKNDGFDSIADFAKWFNKDFTGKIIHWTDYRYECLTLGHGKNRKLLPQ